MADSVILFNNDIVPLSAVSDKEIFDPSDQNMLFFPNGRLKRFVKNNKAYLALFDQKVISNGEPKFRGYFLENNFWDFNKDNIRRNATETDRRYLNFPFEYNYPLNYHPSQNRIVIAYKDLVLEPDGNNSSNLKIDVKYKFFNYEDIKQIIETVDFEKPNNADINHLYLSINSSLVPYYFFIINKQILGANKQLRDLTTGEIDELLEIVQVFNIIISDVDLINYLTTKGIMETFNVHLNLPNRYNTIPFGEIDPKYHNIYNEEYFARFRLKLIEFRYWLLRYKQNYNDINIDELTIAILNIFPVDELASLSYDFKIKAMDLILGKRSGWTNFFSSPTLNLKEEEAIVKIVRSVYREIQGTPNYQEINMFLKFLNSVSSNPNVTKESLTYYEILYRKITDPTLFGDDGRGQKGQFVHAVYGLWLESEYNPAHSDQVIATNALTKFKYTTYRADYDYEVTHKFHEEAAPLLLNYRSEKVLLWYSDNYNFKFYGHKIVALDTVTDTVAGYYNIYQPIALAATNHDDTIIKMPIKGISNVNSPNNAQFVNNCIPIFYLQYVDDLGDYSDAKQVIGTVANVALFFTGIGEIASLRYLRYFSVLKNIGTGLSSAEELLLWKAVGSLTSLAQVLSSAASLIYQIATDSCAIYYNNDLPPAEGTPEFEKYNFCQDVNKWLFALELVSLSADALSRRLLKRASQRMLKSMPADVAASLPNAERQLLNELADIAEDINKFLNELSDYPNVRDHISALKLTDEKKAYEFAFDFKGNKIALQEFNSDITLIDEWDEIEFLLVYKKEINFLKSYKRIKNDSVLLGHIHNGEATLTRKQRPIQSGGGFYNDANVSGYHNLDKIKNPPPGPGEISFKGQPKYSNPLDLNASYQQGKIERNMYDKIDDITNKPWSKKANTPPNSPLHPDHLKVKDYTYNVFWPKNYSTKRINEEMAYAYTTININAPITKVNKEGIISNLYSGKATDGHVIHFQYYDGNIRSGTLKSIYPANF